MKFFTTISLTTIALAGCAGAGQAGPGAATAADSPVSQIQELQRETAEQARRIAELEARLGLLEQESRSERDVPAKPNQTVRIGARPRVEENDDTLEVPPRSRVPIVRLHERESEPEDEPLALPEPPSDLPKLAVVPLPEARATKALRNPATTTIDAREQYRTALRALRDQRWDEALQSFTQFLSAYPEHELAEQATYWRGEVHYARRHYREALIDFEAVVLNSIRGVKTADALLKLGLCHRRLGDQASAERYFRQLREQYPSSDAARIASRENPS